MATALILDCIEYGAGSCRNEDMIIELQARAEAAEAEVERLREQVATARAEGANEERSLHWMRTDAEVRRLRALMAQAVQADLDDDAFALESVIVRMADALDDNGHDAR